MSPTPILNIITHPMGMIRRKKLKFGIIPSNMQKSRKTAKVSAKLIRADTLRDRRNRYFGIFIFENIDALPRSAPIPPFVASEKNEKTMFPQKIYVVICSISLWKN